MFWIVLFTSLIATTLVILFAFFPMRTTWFTRSSDDYSPKPRKRKGFIPSPFTRDPEPYYEEIYDDPEL